MSDVFISDPRRVPVVFLCALGTVHVVYCAVYAGEADEQPPKSPEGSIVTYCIMSSQFLGVRFTAFKLSYQHDSRLILFIENEQYQR